MDVLKLHHDSFSADIVLDRIHELPNANLRQLRGMLREDPEKLEELTAWLDCRAASAKALWAEASQAFTQGWKLVPNKKARDKKTVAILRENTRLKTEVKRSKALYDSIVQIQTIFNKEN